VAGPGCSMSSLIATPWGHGRQSGPWSSLGPRPGRPRGGRPTAPGRPLGARPCAAGPGKISSTRLPPDRRSACSPPGRSPSPGCSAATVMLPQPRSGRAAGPRHRTSGRRARVRGRGGQRRGTTRGARATGW
jgi:hypothetical protein